MGLLYEYVSKEEQKQIDYEDGYTDGMERGIEQGIKRGMEQGIERGIEQGNRNNAAKMKADGLSLDKIVKYTGLSMEEIEAL